MAVDKLVDSTQLDADLTSVANAIRTKGGTSADLAFPAGFVSAVQAIPTGGGGGNLECGTFVIESDTRTFTLNHSLGVVPDFCIVYPINVPEATSSYRIAWEVILRNIGQSDYDISSKSDVFSAPHVMWQGTSYNVGSNGASYSHNVGNGYAGTATTTTFVVGGVGVQGSHGMLSAGEFGYILGVLS